MNCPNCGRSNPVEAAYCAKCGFRLPTAAARGAGVAYRRAEQAEPHGGGGQGLLAFGAVLLAGMLFAVGAVALFLSAPAPSPSPTGVANASPEDSLPIFVQPTASPSPEPTLTPLPSFLGSPSPFPSLPTETPIIGPSPTPTFVGPTPTPPPQPTPTPTPGATPANCAFADGSNLKTIILGTGNEASRGPLPKAWCIHGAIFRPFLAEPGKTRLLENGTKIAADTCAAAECDPEYTRTYEPPHLTPAGSTLAWEFTCIDNPGTPEDECNDAIPGGSTVEVFYEPVPGT